MAFHMNMLKVAKINLANVIACKWPSKDCRFGLSCFLFECLSQHMNDVKYSHAPCSGVRAYEIFVTLRLAGPSGHKVTRNPIMRTQLPISSSAVDTMISWPDGFIFKCVWPCLSKH